MPPLNQCIVTRACNLMGPEPSLGIPFVTRLYRSWNTALSIVEENQGARSVHIDFHRTGGLLLQ
jgi:hypothetical protein